MASDPLIREPLILRVLRVMQEEGSRTPLTTNGVAERAGCARSTASGYLNDLNRRDDIGVRMIVKGVWEYKQLPGEHLLPPLDGDEPPAATAYGSALAGLQLQTPATQPDQAPDGGYAAEPSTTAKTGDLLLMEHLGSTAGGRILVRDTESGVRYLLDPMVK
jgi:hypothetical protein